MGFRRSSIYHAFSLACVYNDICLHISQSVSIINVMGYISQYNPYIFWLHHHYPSDTYIIYTYNCMIIITIYIYNCYIYIHQACPISYPIQLSLFDAHSSSFALEGSHRSVSSFEELPALKAHVEARRSREFCGMGPGWS